jgi:uncharacterized membrane protein
MLVTIPIGLWVFSFICDVVVFFADASAVELLWFMLAYYSMAAGVVAALLAAIPGLIDLVSLKSRSLRRLALTHMTINLVVVALYVLNLWLRSQIPPNLFVGMGLSLFAVGLLLVSGWLGGQMVHVHGVSVADVPPPLDEIPERKASEAATRFEHF